MPDRRQAVFDAFCWLVLGGLAIRVAYFLQHARSPFFAVPFLDESYYDQFARMIISGGDLSHFSGFRPILYPFLLSVVYRVGGSFGIELVLLVQHLLGIATAVLITLIASRLFRSHAAGFLSGALYLLGSPPLFAEGELLVESVYVFMLALTLAIHAAACRDDRRAAALWCLGGAMTALTAQAHAKMLVFSAFYPLCAAHLLIRSKRPAALVPLWGVAGLLAVLVVFGAVNSRQSGSFQIIPGYGGINLYLGNERRSDGMTPRQGYATTYGELYQDSFEIFARREYERAMVAAGKKPSGSPSAVSAYWAGRALEEIVSSPARWARLMGKKAWLLLWNYEIPNNKSFSFFCEHESWILRCLPVRWFALLALAPIGVILARRAGNRRILYLLLSFLILYSAVILMNLVNGRYRLSLWPAMSALAGGGLWECYLAFRARRMKRLTVYAMVLACLSLISLVNWFGIPKLSFARDYYARSLAWYGRGDVDKAYDDIRSSLYLDPFDYKALLHYGNVLFALRRYPEARTAYGRVTWGDPEEPRGWNNLGAACEALGDPAGARKAYLRALACDARDKTALQNLILLELRYGDLARGRALIGSLEALEKENTVVTCALSFLRTAEGDVAGGKALAALAYARDPEVAAWVLKRLAGESRMKP